MPSGDPDRTLAQPWWELTGTERALAAQAYADRLWDDQAPRRTSYLRNVQRFEGIPLTSHLSDAYCRVSELPADPVLYDLRRLGRSACQTARAEIFSVQQPRCTFQTSGASWKTRRQAKRANKIHMGLLHQRQGEFVNVWALAEDGGLEACIQGTFALKLTNDYDAEQVEHALVPVCELYRDPAEGREPNTLVQISPRDAYALKAAFPSHESAIDGAPPYADVGWGLSENPYNRVVKYVEIWRPSPDRSKEGRKKGVHIIVIGGEEVFCEEWSAPTPPFALYHWERHRGSPWGMGLIEEGALLAADVNDLSERILVRAKLAAGKRTYYDPLSVDVATLKANDAETLVPIREGGQIPQETVVPPFTPSEVDLPEMKVRHYWDAIGISQMGATARKEPGVESGVAIRAVNDRADGRQLDKAKAYEQLFISIGIQHVYRIRELAERNPGAVIRWPGLRGQNSLKVADAVLENDDFVVSLDASSSLPESPAGRRAFVSDMYTQGVISPETYQSLLDWPDTEREMDVASAEKEYIESVIDRYLDADADTWGQGDYSSPPAFLFDKRSALLRVMAAYYQAKLDDAPTLNTDLLYAYARELDDMIAKATPVTPPAPPGAFAPPPGVIPPGVAPPAPIGPGLV